VGSSIQLLLPEVVYLIFGGNKSEKIRFIANIFPFGNFLPTSIDIYRMDSQKLVNFFYRIFVTSFLVTWF